MSKRKLETFTKADRLECMIASIYRLAKAAEANNPVCGAIVDLIEQERHTCNKPLGHLCSSTQ